MQSEAFEPFPGGLLLLFRYEPEAYSRRYDPNLIAGLELRRDQGPSILICGPQNRPRWLRGPPPAPRPRGGVRVTRAPRPATTPSRAENRRTLSRAFASAPPARASS